MNHKIDLPYTLSQLLKFAAEIPLHVALSSTSELLCILRQTETALYWPLPVITIPYELSQVAKALVAKEVVRHPDMYVNISVSCCICYILSMFPVKPLYNDRQLKEFFELVVTTFEKLSSAFNGRFTKMSEVIDIFRTLRLPGLMLEMHLDALVVRLFKQFLTVSESTSAAIVSDMEDIMTMIIEEGDKLILELTRLLVTSVKTENQIASPACYQLAEKVLKNCAARLKPYLADMVKQSSLVCVHGYNVKQSVAHILEAIFKKHGDISSESLFKTACTREYFLDVVCEVVRQIQSNDVFDMQEIESKLSDAEAAKLNVSWIRTHLEAIHKMKEGIKKSCLLMETKGTTILVKRAAEMDLKERRVEFEKAERCVKVLQLVEKKLNNNILESKAKKDSWVEQPIL